MRHFWEWLCGYICVCINGRQVNRFLNLCSRNGIHLWRIRYDMEQSLRANLRLRDFYDLKPYLRKTKTKLRILSKKGFPFWCHRHPKLKWFLCLCLCLIGIGFYSLNFVWNIEVKGNTRVSTQDIIDCLLENEVEIGKKKAVIDCAGLEIILRESFHQLGWVSVYIEHTRLCIEVKESLYDTVDYLDTAYGKRYDLVANKDAKIASIVTRAGKAVVKADAYVKQGDVLVLGQNEIYDDSGMVKDTLYFKAQAEIWGDVIYETRVPISEIEILSMKIAGNYDETMLMRMGYHKLQTFLDNLEAHEVIILDTVGMLEYKEKNICFYAKIYAREQIGINIPVEEVLENEFE